MKRVLTGLQPTGNITLGNYIGAIKQMKELENNYDSYLFVADLHSITVAQDPNELRKNTRNLLAIYLACGIDPNKNTIYIQSENVYHTNLSWILECNTYYGEASRMIQFKEKSKGKENFTVGLLTYPILMAADILYCDADYVPVGIDQNQHVEIARDIADRFNKRYGDTFKLPSSLITKQGTKIKDLKDPTKKMSKSEENPVGVISLFDDLNAIHKKIMGATTDSDNAVYFDEENKPGISNLLNIASIMSGREVDDIAKEYRNSGYGNFKRYCAEVTVNKIKSIQDRYNELIETGEIDKILKDGIEKSRLIAKEKCELVKERVGLI